MKEKDSGAPSLDVVLDVPEAPELPETFDVVAYADYLLTSLFRHESGALNGEFKDGVGSWQVRACQDSAEVEIGRLDSLGHFRMVLARFGYWYMAVQLYGGSAQRPLVQRGRCYDCEIRMSNDNCVGYWLRINVKAR